jgi:hypothetical protein
MDYGKVTIQKITQEDTVNAQGQTMHYIRVAYMVGDHGPFFERFDKAGFDPNAAKAKLQQFAQSLGVLHS